MDSAENQNGATSTCSRCGAPFHCGRDDPGVCWCARLPALPSSRYDAAAGCLCEACLRRMLDNTVQSRMRP